MNQGESDAGFTLVELLVVLVIMPLIIGAIAAAIIVSYQDSGLAQNRIADSSNAQISSEYFIRDVQGARYVYAPQQPCSSTNPCSQAQPYPVCTGTHPDPTSSLLLALYRPPTPTTQPPSLSSSALSVAYWVTPGSNSQMQLVRYSCPQGGTMTTVVMSDDLPQTPGNPVTATIVPAQFQTAANAGWTPTTAITTVQTTSPSGIPLPTTSPNGLLTVVSTGGFANGPIGVRSTIGFQNLGNCMVITSTAFSCPGQGSGAVLNGVQVRQQNSIAGISISVTQPGSGSTYSLQAAPRQWGSSLATNAFGPGAPYAASLVTLSSSGFEVGSGANLAVDGSAAVAGPLTVEDNASFTASGAFNTNVPVTCNGTATVTSVAGTVNWCQPGQIATPTPVTDPLASFLTGLNLTAPPTPSPCTAVTGEPLQPGTYNCQLTVPMGVSASLDPGVYVLTQGVTVQSGGSVAMISGTTDGALLYVTGGTADLGDGSTVASLAPLTATQSLVATQNATTALQGVWLWQTDSNPATLSGNGPAGTAYLPASQVTLTNSSSTTTGAIITNSVSLTGGTVTVGGP